MEVVVVLAVVVAAVFAAVVARDVGFYTQIGKGLVVVVKGWGLGSAPIAPDAALKHGSSRKTRTVT